MQGPVFRAEAGRADSADAVFFHEGRARGETDLLRRFLVRRVQNHWAGPEVTIVLIQRLVVSKMIKAKNNEEKGIKFKKHQKETEKDSDANFWDYLRTALKLYNKVVAKYN